MKKAILLSLLFFSSITYMMAELPVHASDLTLYEKLCDVNKEWLHFDPNTNATFFNDRRPFASDIALIQQHLELVEQHLGAREMTNLSPAQKAQRRAGLEILNAYWQQGNFPVNTYHDTRTPYFIDKYNTACAVGHIIRETGSAALAHRIQSEMNYAYLRDIDTEGLTGWVEQSGFTADELAWIQPAYNSMVPYCFQDMDEGTDGGVNVLLTDEANGMVYIGGRFDRAGNQTNVNNIVSYDGVSYYPLGDGVNGTVHSATFDEEGNLYVGIETTTDHEVWKWDGTSWEQIGDGFNGTINSLVFDPLSSNLVAGGAFTSPYNYIVRHDNGTWFSFTAVPNAPVHDMIYSENWGIVVGGEFTEVGASAALHIATLNPDLTDGGGIVWEEWETLGNGLPFPVFALLESNGILYTGGALYDEQQTHIKSVHAYDGTSWNTNPEDFENPIPINSTNRIHQLLPTESGDLLIVGYFDVDLEFISYFQSTNMLYYDVSEDWIMKYHGFPLGIMDDPSNCLKAITTLDDRIYLGGAFSLGETGRYNNLYSYIETFPCPSEFYEIVWPGDINQDGIVDMNDLLTWGKKATFNLTSQLLRPDATTDFTPQPTPAWNPTPVLIIPDGLEHCDATGDGVLNQEDIAVIEQNFNGHEAENVPVPPPANGEYNTTLELSPVDIADYTNDNINDTIFFEVFLKNATNECVVPHGLQFTLNYDPFINGNEVINAEAWFDNSAMSLEEDDLFAFYKNYQDAGKLYLGMTRVSHYVNVLPEPIESDEPLCRVGCMIDADILSIVSMDDDIGLNNADMAQMLLADGYYPLQVDLNQVSATYTRTRDDFDVPQENLSVTNPQMSSLWIQPNLYCIPAASTATDEWVEKVTVGSFVCESGNDAGYRCFPEFQPELVVGNEYSLSLTAGTFNSEETRAWKVWIDANQNDAFEEDEVVYNSELQSSASENGTIQIPLNAEIGLSRMRVAMQEGSAINAACDAINNGEVEDYFLRIVSDVPSITLNTAVILEGAYDAESEQMHTTLLDNDLLPNNQPFSTAPWNYEGLEIAPQFPDNVVDWVLVEMRSANDPTIVVEQRAGLLLANGDIVKPDNPDVGVAFFRLASNEAYHVVVRHRNHLAVVSSEVLVPDAQRRIIYDFTDDISKAAGENALEPVSNGSYALPAGDFNGDGYILVDDFNLYRQHSSSINTYLGSDANMDRAITVADFNLFQNNSGRIGHSWIRYEN